ncbi:MAG TPA: nitroreductase family deazaflavin-dependent oxidoreductase [Actinomycetota bacterium]
MAIEDLAAEQFCYVTSIGRVTGRPHTIEIWFALDGRTLYLLSGGGRASDWVRTLERTPDVTVRLGDRIFPGRARVVTDAEEDERARRLVHDKYQPGYGGDLAGWRRRSLPVALDLDED